MHLTEVLSIKFETEMYLFFLYINSKLKYNIVDMNKLLLRFFNNVTDIRGDFEQSEPYCCLTCKLRENKK